MTRVASEGRTGKVLVRLADIDVDLRMKVADHLIRTGRLRGVQAMLLSMAADQPVQNPMLRVSAEKANRVLRDGKLPIGAFPKF